MEDCKLTYSSSNSLPRLETTDIRPKPSTQQNLVYYSIFDLNVEIWRIENEVIKDFSATLRKNLGNII